MLSTLLPDCIVLDASDGLQGMGILQRRQVDLIVTDLNMPGLGGFAVIEQAKAKFPSLPVYVMTGYCDFKDRELLRGLGISRFFEKPFSFASMAEIAAADLGLMRRIRRQSSAQQGAVALFAR
jgi:CheY-like chemotaxis protein